MWMGSSHFAETVFVILDDPEEIFYLELSFRLLEQEEEKE